MIWKRNLDGAVWEMLNPDFLVCARLWVMALPTEDEAPYYLAFHPFGDLIGPHGNATPIIADDLEHAQEIATAIYQLHDGDNIRRSKYAQP
jgi:hypothetical protein